MLTPDEKCRINTALTNSNGDRKAAAAVLNVTPETLKAYIHNNKDLKALWKKDVPSRLPPADPVVGTTTLVVAETDEQLQNRRTAEFEKLIGGVGDEGQLVELMQLQRAYSRFTEDCESMIGGSLVEQGIKLSRLLNSIGQKLNEGLAGGALDESFISMSITFMEGQKQLARILEVVSGSRASRAKIQALRDAAKQSKGKGKTSFGPKQTNIVAQNVQVTG